MRAAIADGELDPPEDVETFVGRVTRTRISASSPTAHRRQDYEAAFDAAGLVIDTVFQLHPDEGEFLVGEWERSDRFMLAASPAPA